MTAKTPFRHGATCISVAVICCWCVDIQIAATLQAVSKSTLVSSTQASALTHLTASRGSVDELLVDSSLLILDWKTIMLLHCSSLSVHSTVLWRHNLDFRQICRQRTLSSRRRGGEKQVQPRDVFYQTSWPEPSGADIELSSEASGDVRNLASAAEDMPCVLTGVSMSP